MNLLLDTCTFLWLDSNPAKVSKAAMAALLDSGNRSHLSAASAWEIAAKFALGRLPLPARPEVHIPRVRELSGIESLAVDEESALYAARLPKLHTDPFDRLLIAQAILRDMVLLTPDEAIAQYGGRVIW